MNDWQANERFSFMLKITAIPFSLTINVVVLDEDPLINAIPRSYRIVCDPNRTTNDPTF